MAVAARLRASRSHLLMKVGAFLFVLTGLFLGALLASLGGV